MIQIPGLTKLLNSDGVTPIDPLAETTFTARVGEVQTTPAVNTVLGRLKTLATLLAGGLPAALGAGGGLKVDGSGTPLGVIAPAISTATTPAGQITVTTAGTAVQGPNVALANGVYIRALSTNAGVCWIGNTSGDVHRHAVDNRQHSGEHHPGRIVRQRND